MKRKSKIIISVVGITIVALALLGLTYAYFLTQITGNENDKSISVTTANLQLVYADGNGAIIGDGKVLMPDNDNPVGTKVFTVTNNGNETIEDYAVILENFAVKYHSGSKAGEVTSFVNGEDGEPDMKLVITCKSYKNYTTSKVETGTCDGLDGFLPEKSDILVINDIEKDITHEYTATLTYLDDGTNQSDDMNKTIEGKFNIIDTKNTVDVTGTVQTYTKGDKVTINSEYKESVIYPDGTYKLMGVKPDVHTIKVSNTEIGKVSVTTGNEAKTDGTTTNNGTTIPEVTITEKSRTLTINIKSELEIGSITNLEKGILLADAIIENASKGLNGTTLILDGSIESKVANEASGENERVLATTEDDYTATTSKLSYYFRGNVQNNYVTFADMCWRIVRIKGNGNVKLILEDKDNTCEEMAAMTSTLESYNNDKGDFDIANKAYGYIINDNQQYIIDYLGYAGGMADEFKNYQTTLAKKIDSSIGETPTAEQVKNTLASKLEVGDWCNTEGTKYDSDYQTILTQDQINNKIINYESFYYDSYVRLDGRNPKEPTLKCNGYAMSKFRDNTDMYVGTLTVDEIAYAGGGNFGNIYYYLMNDYVYFGNENGNYIYWWSLSPSYFGGDLGYDLAFLVHGYGDLSAFSVDDSSHDLRPSVSLKSSTRVVAGGEGTLAKPYVIG